MISLKKIRKEPEVCSEKLRLKQENINLKTILELDQKLRELKTISNDMRAERNSTSELIGSLKRRGKDSKNTIVKMRELGDELKLIERDMKVVSTNLENSLYSLPNLPHDSVPDGKDESGNLTVRSWGSKPKFSYEPKDHIQLSKELKLFDFKRC